MNDMYDVARPSARGREEERPGNKARYGVPGRQQTT